MKLDGRYWPPAPKDHAVEVRIPNLVPTGSKSPYVGVVGEDGESVSASSAAQIPDCHSLPLRLGSRQSKHHRLEVVAILISVY